MTRNVAADQCSADFFCVEGRDLRVERADARAFLVVERRKIDRAGNMIFGEFRLGTHIDHLVKPGELCYGNQFVVAQ